LRNGSEGEESRVVRSTNRTVFAARDKRAIIDNTSGPLSVNEFGSYSAYTGAKSEMGETR
jgi:hypothetical protein